MLWYMGYAGGKAGDGVFHRIISLMPPHKIYIEPFMGGFSIGRLKRPARFTEGIDRDRAAVEKARVPAELAAATTYTSVLHAGLYDAGFRRSPLIRTFHSISPPRFPAHNGYESDFFRFEEGDGIAWLESTLVHVRTFGNWAMEGPVLIYCDPPYLRETCKTRCRYKYDLSEADHRRLLRVLQDLNALPEPCRPMLMVSGYDSQMYREALATLEMHLQNGPLSGDDAQRLPRPWNHITFQAITRGGPATEHLWFNFPPPTVLHDNRYVGTNFRDRERMKRVRATWKKKLERMKPYEREAIAELVLGQNFALRENSQKEQHTV